MKAINNLEILYNKICIKFSRKNILRLIIRISGKKNILDLPVFYLYVYT